MSGRSVIESPALERENYRLSLIAASTAWQEHAACLPIDTAIFFPNSSSTAKTPSTAWDTPRTICEQCTVRGKCLDFAIKWRLMNGMYGGKTPEERVTIRNRRKKEGLL